MNSLKKHIALFLFVVLSVYIVPKELVHELYSHHDTIDISAHEEDVPNQVSSGKNNWFMRNKIGDKITTTTYLHWNYANS